MNRSPTIVALSSGLPPSGVAVLRASGPDAPALASAFGLDPLPPRRAVLRTVRSPVDGDPLDRALCLAFAAPSSATGEDVVEIHLHGGPALVERVLADAVTVAGVRLAEPGEFTLRAVLAGRMGLHEAEALADLLEARTEAERRRASRLADGALTRRLAAWRERLVSALALAEAHLDFSDEGDVAIDATSTALMRADLVALADEIAAAVDGSIGAEKLTDGLLVALVGPPNAGKSSLLNALAGREAAIVSPEAGTTRDVVTVTLDLGGYRVTLADTAGLREGATGVEAIGIARTESLVTAADVVIAVRSPDTPPLPDPPGAILVGHKADIAPAGWGADRLLTSATDGRGLAHLSRTLADEARRQLSASESALITHARQRAALYEVATAVRAAASEPRLEINAEHLRAAADALGRVTGAVGVEDVLDAIFGRFCIGK
jgi:tRNA modification GTPase